jgi:lipid-binding SYLF domain-containing protein
VREVVHLTLKGNPMNTRTLLTSALVAVVAVSGCVTNSSPGFEAGPAPRMEEGVATTMTALYDSAPGARELAAKARGILVFPRVVDGGVIVGGEYGRGQLSIDGRNAGSYKVTSISLGLQAGLQSQSLVLMFMSQEALDRFTSKSNWTAGADASVALGRVGANGRIETLGDTGVIAFALTNAGVMAGAKVDGTRISKLAS